MKLLKRIFTIAIALQLVVATSCEFGDINNDPNNLNEDLVQMRQITPLVIGQSVFNRGALAGRMPGIVIGHFFGFDAQQVPYSTYSFNESDMNNLWVTGLYNGSMNNIDRIIEQSIEEDQRWYGGIAKILLAHDQALASQIWGDVPLTRWAGGEAFDPEIDFPGFASQQAVFAGVQSLLDEAITDLQTPQAPGFPLGDDIMFGGDPQSWIRTARALKARYALMLSRRNGAAAYTDALNFIGAGTFTSNAQEAILFFDAAQTGANPYAQFGNDRPKTLVVDNDFEAFMAGLGDPRKDSYMALDGSEWVFYLGPTGNNLFWAQNDSPLTLISYSEVEFIRAEALLQSGGGVAAAEAALQSAMQANMDQLGIDPVAAGAYVSTRGDLASLANDTQRLERIMEEKYIALYSQAETEAWSDWRRTGFPALTPRAGGINGNNPSGGIPVRFLYPNGERTTNEDAMEAAIANQNCGENCLLDDPMWAFE